MEDGMKVIISLALACMSLLGVEQALAADADLDCKLRFSLTGWSAIYNHADGKGIVTCADGSSLPVTISAKGAGITAGRSRIDEGTGKFTDVHKVDEVLGHYAQGEVHAGVLKSATAQLLTKGTVSLALAGHGEGIDLGLAVGEFTLKRQE
jgi:hypothetical protein